MRFIALALATGLAAAPAFAADSYMFDPGHTQIRASWDHAGYSTQSLHFREISGDVKLDVENPANSSMSVSIPLASIDSGIEAFDQHLASGDFFDTSAFPTANFVSTSVEKTSDTTLKVVGDLTIKDVTKPVTLDVVVNNVGDHPLGQFVEFYQGEWIGVTATATIVRSEWGLGMFAPITSDEVELFISTEMKKQ